jgi:hypothetical protein
MSNYIAPHALHRMRDMHFVMTGLVGLAARSLLPGIEAGCAGTGRRRDASYQGHSRCELI